MEEPIRSMRKREPSDDSREDGVRRRHRDDRRRRSVSRSRSRSRSVERRRQRGEREREREKYRDDRRERERDRERVRDRDSRYRGERVRDRSYYGSRGDEKAIEVNNSDNKGVRRVEAVLSAEELEERRKQREIDDLTKDQRTIFVSQLTKKVTERNLEDFFGQVGKVKNIIMLRDKASGAHKGFAYVEMADLEAIPNCLLFNGVVPDFQKFPILVKASEAEKNFLAKKESAAVSNDYSSSGIVGVGGIMSTQQQGAGDTRVYVGNIHISVDEAGIRPLLEQFGAVESIKLHRDHLGNSKGFAFVKYASMEGANLCMMSLGGTELAGRPLKVGSVIDQNQKALQLMAAAQGGGGLLSGTSSFPVLGGHTMIQPGSLGADLAGAGNWKLDADDGQGQGLGLTSSSRAILMAKLGQSAGLNVPVPSASNSGGPVIPPAVPPVISGDPSTFLMIANMFDPASETGDDWELDIKEDVMAECTKHGQVLHVHVETKKPGGIVLLKFASIDGAQKTAMSLNGRYFAQRQITCAFLAESIYKELLLE